MSWDGTWTDIGGGVPIVKSCLVDWGCRIHWMLLCSRVTPATIEGPGYGGMKSIPSLPSLPGPLWPRVVDKVLSMDKIELNGVLMLNWIVWNGTVFVS